MLYLLARSANEKGTMIKCLYCNLPQGGNLQFIEGYCWNCLSKAQASSGLPIEVIAGLMKEGAVIK
jgi:hypothetical protein